jgi:hypothetical protein
LATSLYQRLRGLLQHRVEHALKLLRGRLLVDTLDGGELAGQAVQRRLINLPSL